MIRGENSDSIPNDLIIKIISRLHAKSIARFRCVSKLWTSKVNLPYFIELFLTRSLAWPRLLFFIQRKDECILLTLPQPHNPYGNSSLVLAAEFHMKLPGGLCFSGLASGLIYVRHIVRMSKVVRHKVLEHVICNPSTGQYVRLPNGNTMKRGSRSYLGFDLIDKQFKILSRDKSKEESAEILALGTENLEEDPLSKTAYRFQEGDIHQWGFVLLRI